MTNIFYGPRVTQPLARHIEALTDIWFGPMAAANGFWHTARLAKVDAIFMNWNVGEGLLVRPKMLAVIADGFNTQCKQPVITTRHIRLALTRLLSGAFAESGCLMIWVEGSQVHFLMLPVVVK